MNLIITGPPGTGKRLWLKKLVTGSVLYVTMDIPPEDIVFDGISVDCYSERIGESSQKYRATYAYDLDEIFKEISHAMEEFTERFTGKYMVIDSLTPLILTVGIHPVYRFLQKLLAYASTNSIEVIALLHAGAHKKREERSILHLFDDALLLEKLNNREKIEYYYHRMHDAKKKEYYMKEGEIRE